jgi:hypothetical protein
MIQEFQLKLAPSQANDIEYIKTKVAEIANISATSITVCKVLKRSIDARNRQIVMNTKVFAVWDEEYNGNESILP